MDEENRPDTWESGEEPAQEPVPAEQPDGAMQVEEPQFLFNGEPQPDIPLLVEEEPRRGARYARKRGGPRHAGNGPEDGEPKKKSVLREIWWFFRPAVICCALLLLVTTFLVFYAVVPSGSMEPTIMTNSFILANRRAYDRSGPQRGDVVVFETDQSDSGLLVKRVIATEGELVELRGGDVYVDGEKLAEPYAVGQTLPNLAGSVFHVPEGCVLVFGDNRIKSADARYWKNPYVPVSNIKGRVFLTFSLNPKDFYFRPVSHGDAVQDSGVQSVTAMMKE